jgi:endonuclease III
MKTHRATRKRIARIVELLEGEYGRRGYSGDTSAADVLVETILSQSTTGTNTGAGFRRLRERFSTWDHVADAPVAEVERAISICGLSRTKAPRIQQILRQIRRERGRIDLAFLARMTPREATEYLEGFKGVGPKTAACVLLFSFDSPVFPVDTHVNRICRRMELVMQEATPEQTQAVITPLIEPGSHCSLHLLLIAHGRAVCLARRGRCDRCVLSRMCPSSRTPRAGYPSSTTS